MTILVGESAVSGQLNLSTSDGHQSSIVTAVRGECLVDAYPKNRIRSSAPHKILALTYAIVREENSRIELRLHAKIRSRQPADPHVFRLVHFVP